MDYITLLTGRHHSIYGTQTSSSNQHKSTFQTTSMMHTKATAAEHHSFPQELPSNKTHEMEPKHLQSILALLRDQMGMCHKAASNIAKHASKHNSPKVYMSTFLHAAIEEQINEYRKQSFAKFGLMISVYPSPNARQMELFVEHFDKVTIGYHSYVFKVQHNKTPKKAMRVRLFRGSIQVQFCGSWRPVAAYLDEIGTDWTHPECLERQLDHQRSWWKANGKSFDITKFPGEIRNAMYDCVFPAEAQPFPSSRKNNHVAPTFQRSYTALMRTNKQLHDEASDWFYNTTTFTIDYRHLFSKTLDERNHFLRDRLRHVRLALDHSEYLELFSPRAWDASTKPYVKHQLRKMSNLKSLEIHFHAPSRIATKTWLEGACQKTAVDMIMDAAWPSIRGLPVTITGYVKDSQKKAIEAHVQSERNMYGLYETFCRGIGKPFSLGAYDSWVEWMMAEKEGGVRLDGEPRVEVEADEVNRLQWNCMSTQDLRMLMWCSCEKRCCLEEWDPAD